MKGFFFFSFIFLNILFLGCGQYKYEVKGALRRFEQGDYKEAASQLEKKAKRKGVNQLLFKLERGIILHTGGFYSESNREFAEARELIQYLDYENPAEQAASLLTNESVVTYKGEDFERILIPVYMALNFLMLGQREEALVEAKKLDLLLQDLFQQGRLKKWQHHNPFANYLSGLIYESLGEKDEAYIDYKRVYQIKPDFPYLAPILLNLAGELKFHDEFSQWQERYGPVAMPTSSTSMGELAFILELGLGPEKVPHSRFPIFPKYRQRTGSIHYAKIFIADKYIVKTSPLWNVGQTATEYLEEKVLRLVAKRALALGIKEGISEVIARETESQEAGILSRLLLLSTEEPDLRSWLTLPQEFQLARLYLPSGQYDVRVKFYNAWNVPIAERIFKNVTIQPSSIYFLNWRTVR